jgi:putative membrane protein
MATTPTSGASGAGMTITGGDPEILNVLAVVDQGEVQDGQMAQRQARNARVKSYARELVQAHTKSLQKDRQLAKAANVELMNASGRDSSSKSDTSAAATAATSGGTGVAAQIHQMHVQASQRLKSLKGADFDSAFVNAQVMGHQQVLDLLQRAQNQAQNADVQNHVADAVKEVQTHLDRARELQQSLTSGGTGAVGDSASKTRADTGRRG